MSPPPQIPRRLFLRALAAAPLALAACGQEPGTESEPVALVALRRAARMPGPALGRFANLTQPPGRTVRALPFAPDAVPGFSPAGHHVHYEHHYIEYICRWVEEERALLDQAVALANGAEGARPTAVLARAEALRLAANMVVLHEAYWDGFWSGGPARRTNEVAGTEKALLRLWTEHQPDWFVAADDGRLHLFAEPDSVPDGADVRAGIDCPLHSWGLDFPGFPDYVRRLLRNMAPAAFDALAATAGRPAKAVAVDPDATAAALARAGGPAPLLEALHTRHPDIDAAAALDGLRRAVGPRGAVALLARTGTQDRTFALLADGMPSGIWNHAILAACAGA